MNKLISWTNRNQLALFVSSIDLTTAQNNLVRLIDLFIDSLKLPDFGFDFQLVENGRPAYHLFDVENFKYDISTDFYRCPANETLTPIEFSTPRGSANQ